MNRGIAKRTVFESSADVRFFLACLARAVHRGELEIHAFCILTTHFHLLVRCPEGNLGGSMQRAMNTYVRWFNRTRQRDGPLFRGRFRSRPAKSEAYRRVLVRYIDFNAVEAGLAGRASEYMHGSASRHVRSAGTPWLERGWIRALICAYTRGDRVDAGGYESWLGARLREGWQLMVDRRIELSPLECDPLDDLLGAAPHVVLEWMQRKTFLADGTDIGLPVCDPQSIRDSIEAERIHRPDWVSGTGRGAIRPRDLWLQLENGLLRDLSGLSGPEVSRLLHLTPAWSWKSQLAHRGDLEQAAYAEVAARVAKRAIDSVGAIQSPRANRYPDESSTEPGSIIDSSRHR